MVNMKEVSLTFIDNKIYRIACLKDVLFFSHKPNPFLHMTNLQPTTLKLYQLKKFSNKRAMMALDSSPNFYFFHLSHIRQKSPASHIRQKSPAPSGEITNQHGSKESKRGSTKKHFYNIFSQA